MESSRRYSRLRFDRRLIDQHDGDVILYRIDPVALRTFQALRVLTVLKRLLARRANQNLQKVFAEHDLSIVYDSRLPISCDATHKRMQRESRKKGEV